MLLPTVRLPPHAWASDSVSGDDGSGDDGMWRPDTADGDGDSSPYSAFKPAGAGNVSNGDGESGPYTSDGDGGSGPYSAFKPEMNASSCS